LGTKQDGFECIDFVKKRALTNQSVKQIYRNKHTFKTEGNIAKAADALHKTLPFPMKPFTNLAVFK
jgi:hypothetical protein